MPPIPNKPRSYQSNPAPPSDKRDTCSNCHIHFAWIESKRNYCYWCETNTVESRSPVVKGKH